jgi:hypothetical protein
MGLTARIYLALQDAEQLEHFQEQEGPLRPKTPLNHLQAPT